jgi:hypothetical protein
MPSANKLTTPVAVDLPKIQGRHAELDGYSVGYESYQEDLDPAPMRACRSGRITFRWVDHEETYGAGDANYAGPGHLPLITAGTSLVEFSPTDSLQQTMAVIEANLATGGVTHDDHDDDRRPCPGPNERLHSCRFAPRAAGRRCGERV